MFILLTALLINHRPRQRPQRYFLGSKIVPDDAVRGVFPLRCRITDVAAGFIYFLFPS